MDSPTIYQPFDMLYQAFRNWNLHGLQSGRKFIAMSAGVNWSTPTPAVIELLGLELGLNMTTRNYGHAGGLPPVTRILELVEQRLHGQRALAATIVHGTTEGAHLALQAWRQVACASPGNTGLLVGHGFPLYQRLCADFGLKFVQCLGDIDNPASQLPSREQLAAMLARHQPKVIFVILPNNPLSELAGTALLEEIGQYAQQADARILVDRVCLMPWDDATAQYKVLGSLLASGHAVAVDSLSKSESLAGLRCGFLVSDPATKAAVMELIKSRFLNPVVFPTATLATVRLAQTMGRAVSPVTGACRRAHDRMFAEYPGGEAFHAYFEKAQASLPALVAGTQARQALLRQNFATLQRAFAGRLVHPLRLDAGFNVTLTADAMAAAREPHDHVALLQEHGVGTLSTRCFSSVAPHRHYFLRIGLTLPAAEFAEGAARLVRYFYGAA